ncbi:MAG TPA: NAD-dependent deacylase [Prolixibacteraceae bacterium]|nr:NAD-dependent deacylase [Prolixibacteraceae bacterium]
MKKKLVILTGAGMSQESGIRTFRDMGGLWEEYDIEEVATPEAWRRNPELVMRFYNDRRKQLLESKPNAGHVGLVDLENDFDVHIITQNVDDLHERAGSKSVLHLHGELKKARSSVDENLIYDIDGWELKFGQKCAKGSQLRPFIVWFGEAVPAMEDAIRLAEKADIMVVIGTSLNVYPAAGLVNYVQRGTPIFVVDPERPSVYIRNVIYIEEKASKGVEILKQKLKELI